jgi:hypothetical protein
MTDKADTRTDRILSRLKDHWLLSGLIVFGIIVISLSQFTSSLEALRRMFGPGPRPALTAEYCTLLAPLVVQLDRTKDAFARWNDRNLPLETHTIRDGNLKARDLLEKHSQLVPFQLQEARRKLVEHYDRWLEEYQKLRQGPEANPKEAFVFVGPEGYPFPTDAEASFRARLEYVRNELGGQPACP